MKYINVERHFHILSEQELADSDALARATDREYYLTTDDWSAVLKQPRVVILAEAGAGKTEEMKMQVKALKAQGKPAFFLPLEDIAEERLEELIGNEELQHFESWRNAQQDEIAWFFLDSVDELKLNNKTLPKALRKFSLSVRGCLSRAHVVISCRPNDWRVGTDDVAVEEKLQIPTLVQKEQQSISSEEAFLEPLRRGSYEEPSDKKSALITQHPAEASLQTYALVGLSNKQVHFFGEESGIKNADDFLAEIERLDAWGFVRHPLDLLETIAYWKRYGTLGTLRDRHESNITLRLKEVSDRPDKGVLSDEKIREGAERLALSLTLTHNQTILSPTHQSQTAYSSSALNPAESLPDWTQEERETLLRRGVFDPATYGHIRFHHRSVREYLAAIRLHSLLSSGMSTRTLFSLLFAEKYHHKVIIPSMRPVAAWLSLWNEIVRNEVMNREPEVLLSLGDPGSLPTSARIKLLRAFVCSYSQGGWRGLRIPTHSIQRLACIELEPVIQELWKEGSSNPDVREVLLELIWRGKMEGCIDIALKAARNTDFDENGRALAIHALIACKQTQDLRAISHELVHIRNAWPASLVHNIVAELFPKFLSVSDLITLIKDIPEPRSSTAGFSWELRYIIASLEPDSPVTSELRNSLANLIWEGRETDKKFYELFSQFDYLSADLVDICCRQFDLLMGTANPEFIHCCTVAVLFTNTSNYRSDNAQALKERFRNTQAHKNHIFTISMDLIEHIFIEKEALPRFHQLFREGMLDYPAQGDKEWLTELLHSQKSKATHRAVALEALLELWRQSGRKSEEVESIKRLCSDDDSLLNRFLKATTPLDPKYLEELRLRDEEHKRHQQEYKQREENRLQESRGWRDEVVKNPDNAFSEERRVHTLENVYKWLHQKICSNSKYSVWDKEALIEAFSEDFAHRAEKELCRYWRETQPPLWSRLKPEDRNYVYRSTQMALMGLTAESSKIGWCDDLSESEAETAVAWSLQELNGFACFQKDLVRTKPAIVEKVIAPELTYQLNMVESEQHLQLLQNLSYAEPDLKRLFAHHLISFLDAWPDSTRQPEESNLVRHLDQVLRILSESRDVINTENICRICSEKYKKSPNGLLSLTWLQGLFRFDIEEGTLLLTTALAAQIKLAQKQGMKSFARLFGGRDSSQFEGYDQTILAKCLSTLIKAAYTFLPPDSDPQHDGVFTPNLHDDAVAGRSFLLNQLLETPGPEAQTEIESLAQLPLFSHIPDRLRLLARERAAKDAEFEPLTSEQISRLEKTKGLLANDRDTLFAVMMDRVEQISEDLADHDLTDRKSLQCIKQEEDMQKSLAMKFYYLSQGAYIVSREDEVADSKRTDIRLSAVRGNHKAAIELKLADNWGVRDFERALEVQLVGQYLRHGTGQAGCLLLTYHGRKKYWKHPETGNRLYFSQVIEHLKEKAIELEIAHKHNIRITVFGIDLTKPVLASAHGKHGIGKEK